MKKLINIKVAADDLERWQAAVKKEGRTVSDVCRAALERLARRVEKNAAKSDENNGGSAK